MSPKAKKEQTEDIMVRLDRAIATLVTSDDWVAALKVQAKLHKYSMSNTWLIMMQRPTATMVASYNAWLKLGRQVMKGEKSIKIMAPRITKRENAKGEEKRGMYFVSVSVFDVSQTEGEPIAEHPQPVLLEGGAPEGMLDALLAKAADLGIKVTTNVPGMGDVRGVIRWADQAAGTKEIRIADGLSEAQQCKTLSHELSHAVLGHLESGEYHLHRGTMEVEAESAAFVVSYYWGMPTDGYSFPYVASWSNSDPKVVKSVGGAVHKAVKAILGTTESEESGAGSN